jgi:hypothetical protein
MKTINLSILICIISVGYVNKPLHATESDRKIKVISFKKGQLDRAQQRFAGKRFKVISSDTGKDLTKLPSIKRRDQHFRTARIVAFTQNNDQLYKDELYLRAGSLSLLELTRRYPSIPKSRLAHLKKLVRSK